MIGHAKAYARRGWRMIPIHGLVQVGDAMVCTCGNRGCHSAGKHPRVEKWRVAATTDRQWLEAWFTQWPEMNLGIVTGKDSGLVVLDVDGQQGEESLDALFDRNGPLPDTPMVITGGGGLHYVFKHPGEEVRNSAGKIAPGIDIRGDGGYIVAAPSIHTSGRRYEWEGSSDPGQVPLADMPPWLLEAAKQSGQEYRPPRKFGAQVPEGQRNEYMASLAGSMHRREFDPDVIFEALQAMNARRCHPPLAEGEVAKVVKSITTLYAR